MRKILVVEDEEILRESYELLLATQPYDVHTAEHGAIALERCQQTQYDLILLDLMMPVLDGVGFLKAFMPLAPEHTRVILMTNLSSGLELEEALKLGAERSVLKASMAPRELLSLVRYELEAS
ncbi:MAG: DNA-binding response regulator VicR [Candidatus Saccharibacteria bacterium]|nr:DNA-binding response regulator VicR [Candidatus Saccharibacteria bacterium]